MTTTGTPAAQLRAAAAAVRDPYHPLTLVNPGLMPVLADWLDVTDRLARHELTGSDGRWFCMRCSCLLGEDDRCGWDEALAVARAILGEAERLVRPDSWECPRCHCLFERAGFDHEPCAHLGETDG